MKDWTFDEWDDQNRNERRAHYDDMCAEIARLTAERDAERAGRERAERVARWLATHDCALSTEPKHCFVWFIDGEGLNEHVIYHDGTEADIYRALVEACEGGRDHG